MYKLDKIENFCLVFIFIFLLVLPGGFSKEEINFDDREDILNYAPEVEIKSNTARAPFVSPAPVPNCEKPQELFFSNNIISPKIYGRNIVFISNQNSIDLYDLGEDNSFGTSDDRGSFKVSLQNDGFFFDVSIYGSHIVFNSIESNNSGPPTNKVYYYSLGRDGIMGTKDDYGPKSIYSVSITPQTSLDHLKVYQDFVSFRKITIDGRQTSFTNYYCTLDNSDCQNGIIKNIPSAYNSEGIGSGNSNYWSYFFNKNNVNNLYFIDSMGQVPRLIEGNYFPQDYSFPLILFRENLSNIYLGFYGAPEFKVNLSNNADGYSGSVSKNKDSSNLYRISWIETSQINGLPEIRLVTFPLSSSLIIPSDLNKIIKEQSIDKDNLIFTVSTSTISFPDKVYITKCQFDQKSSL